MTTTLCYCYRIERLDGVVMGFTDHDQALTIDGIIYEPTGGFDRSSAESRVGAAIDSIDLQGAISSDRITIEDVRDGRYDDAKVFLLDVDWKLSVITRTRATYIVAQLEVKTDNAITVTIETETETLWNIINQSTVTGNCPYVLGDTDCGVVVAATSAQVIATDGRTYIETSAGDPATGTTWRGGSVSIGGRSWEIARHEGVRLVVYGALAGVSVGAFVSLLPGCEKTLENCNVFSNVNRFGGYPHTPTQDMRIRIARQGDGTEKNGGSLFE